MRADPDIDRIYHNAVDVIPREELDRRLRSGATLRVKLGIDPTAPDIHLGFVVVLRKLREFQDLGHTAVLMDRWRPEEMLRLIDRYRVTHSHMVPTQFHRLLDLPEERLAELDGAFGLSKSGNSEILFAWLDLGIGTHVTMKSSVIAGTTQARVPLD